MLSWAMKLLFVKPARISTIKRPHIGHCLQTHSLSVRISLLLFFASSCCCFDKLERIIFFKKTSSIEFVQKVLKRGFRENSKIWAQKSKWQETCILRTTILTKDITARLSEFDPHSPLQSQPAHRGGTTSSWGRVRPIRARVIVSSRWLVQRTYHVGTSRFHAG